MKTTASLTAVLLALAMTANAQTWIDITEDYVQNPGFEGNTTEGWTIDRNCSGRGADVNAMEFWQGTWNIRQTIHLPNAGRYRVSVQGYYRPGSNDDNAVAAHDNGTEDITCYLYANDQSVPMTSVYACYSTSNSDGCWRYRDWSGGGYRYYPNTMESGIRFFGQGYYADNQVVIDLEADEELTFGLFNNNWASNNWTLFDNWKLEYYGTEVKVTSIRLDKSRTTMTQGEQLQLTPTISPANATYKGVTFTSSNESAATVDANGVVTAIRPGITTISVTSNHYESISAKCIITVKANEVSSNAVIINEIQQSNLDMFLDPSFNFGGWVELYNATDKEVWLNGLYLSDDAKDLKKMPLYSSIHGVVPARGFCTLWFDHFSRWSPKTMNFKLDADGGSLYLSDEQGNILSQLAYPPAITRTSYARTTDGGSTWSYTDQPTPSASNTTSQFASIRLAIPTVERPGGFFTEPFTLHVDFPQGTTLRYTTDGSTPTLANGQTSNDGNFSISKTTVLRLRLFQTGKLASAVLTHTYIYKDKEYTLPVISLVSDNKNLYGQDYGIFVQGNGNGRPGNGQSSPCNWNMDWDREANIEYFDETGLAVFSQEVGIEASGGWSRAWTPHSFNIKANKIYEGVNRMDYQFFENKPFLRHKALKVRNGGNDTGDRIKDPAIQEVIRTSGLYVETQSYKPVHIFHNGQYIGVENLREPNNKNYGYANYGIDTDEMDQWKMSPDSGYVQQEGTRDIWEEWYSLAQNASDALAYERIRQIVDIEEYINYMAVELYIAGTDWPKNNIKGFRERSEAQSNSRFRFIVFDTDGAFATSNPFNWFQSTQWYNFDPLYGVSDLYPSGRIYAEIEFVTIFLNMLKNEEFKKQFVDQFCLVAGSVFEPTRVAQIISRMVEYVNPAMALEGRSASNSANSVRNNLNASRQSSLITAMRDFLGLGTSTNVTLSSNIEEATLRVNGLQVPTNQFSGSLFRPVTLQASAPAGYKFVGWLALEGGLEKTAFGKGSSWMYYDQGSLDDEDWKAVSYNTEKWESGYAPLGYFTSDGNNQRGYQTFLDYGGNTSYKYPTYYFRKQIDLSSTPRATDTFLLDWVADDGFVIYVNGEEAGRFLMSNTPTPTFNDFADTYANANPESGSMKLDASLFRKGTNVIAVEVHNNAANSTDIYWDAALLMTTQAEDSYVSTDETFELNTTTKTSLVATYEPLSASDLKNSDAHPVKINEVSAANDVYVNELFKKSDWIELYNTTDEEIDVEGMYLSDHLEDPCKFQITANGTDASTIIPAHGHLVIWADKNLPTVPSDATASQPRPQLHADFKLNNEDSCLVLLTAVDQSWADTLVYCRHDGFHSVGLFPDGSSDLYVMERPTIGQTNVITTNALVWNEPEVHAAVDGIRTITEDNLLAFDGRALTLHAPAAARLDIFTPSGQLVHTARLTPAVPHDLTFLSRGIYIARATLADEETTLKFTIP